MKVLREYTVEIEDLPNVTGWINHFEESLHAERLYADLVDCITRMEDGGDADPLYLVRDKQDGTFWWGPSEGASWTVEVLYGPVHYTVAEVGTTVAS
jgi:uncharacterized membrane protein